MMKYPSTSKMKKTTKIIKVKAFHSPLVILLVNSVMRYIRGSTKKRWLAF